MYRNTTITDDCLPFQRLVVVGGITGHPKTSKPRVELNWILLILPLIMGLNPDLPLTYSQPCCRRVANAGVSIDSVRINGRFALTVVHT
jgi:hypothetical protein